MADLKARDWNGSSNGLATYVAALVREQVDAIQVSAIAERYQALSGAQTTWTLTNIPKQPGVSKLFVNGLLQRYAIDYQINGTIVTWIGFPLKNTWDLEIYYV